MSASPVPTQLLRSVQFLYNFLWNDIFGARALTLSITSAPGRVPTVVGVGWGSNAAAMLRGAASGAASSDSTPDIALTPHRISFLLSMKREVERVECQAHFTFQRISQALLALAASIAWDVAKREVGLTQNGAAACVVTTESVIAVRNKGVSDGMGVAKVMGRRIR